MRRVDNANQRAGAGAGAGAAGSFDKYQFDFGLGNGLSKGSSNAPLKDQKQVGSGSPWSSPSVPQQPPPPSQSAAAASSGWSAGGSYQASSGWSSQKSMGGAGGLGGGSKTPSQSTGWSGYQPMTQGLGGPNKSAGAGAGSLGGIGIGGGGFKSMNGGPMMNSSSSSIRSDASRLTSAGAFGLAQNQSSKGADVFGDLLGPALNRSNAPLNSQPGPKLPFAMDKLDSSLPKPAGGVASSEQQIPMAKMAKQPTTTARPPPPPAPASAPEPMATRRPTQNSAERDPFPSVPAGSSSSNVSFETDFFSFPGGPSPAVNGPSGGVSQDDPFGMSGGSTSSNMGGGGSSADPFGFGVLPNQSMPQQQTARSTTSSPSPMAGGDPFDVFKASPSSSSASQSRQSPVAEPVGIAQDDGWGMFDMGEGLGAGDNEPTTTELEGLPPPPVGVTAQAATEKGSEFYKNGQFPDAIKWVSWSMELLKKGKPSKELLLENLSCRVSCYKEIGEMKKAVADCTQAIGLDKTNTSLIMLRSNLYESMEKYKLGVADLRLVLKIDSNHRQARTTLMRLERMIDQ